VDLTLISYDTTAAPLHRHQLEKDADGHDQA